MTSMICDKVSYELSKAGAEQRHTLFDMMIAVKVPSSKLAPDQGNPL